MFTLLLSKETQENLIDLLIHVKNKTMALNLDSFLKHSIIISVLIDVNYLPLENLVDL